jgi:hypothetical protein
MVFLQLLFNPKGIFSFVQIKKQREKKLRVSRFAVFGRHVQMTLVMKIIILSHHMIRLNVICLSRWRVCNGYGWPGFNLHFFFFLLFLPRIGCWACKKLYKLFNFFFILIKFFFS